MKYLEKLNIRDEFLEDWNIEEYDDMAYDNQQFFNNDIIFLLIYNKPSNSFDYYNKRIVKITKTIHYIVRNNLKELEEITTDLTFKGEIFVEDYEINAKRFNM